MTRPSSAGRHENSGARAVSDEFDGEDGTRPLAENEWARWRDVLTTSTTKATSATKATTTTKATSATQASQAENSQAQSAQSSESATQAAETLTSEVQSSEVQVADDVRVEAERSAAELVEESDAAAQVSAEAGADIARQVDLDAQHDEDMHDDADVPTNVDVPANGDVEAGKNVVIDVREQVAVAAGSVAVASSAAADVAETPQGGAGKSLPPAPADIDVDITDAALAVPSEDVVEWITDATTDPGSATDTTSGWDTTDTDLETDTTTDAESTDTDTDAGTDVTDDSTTRAAAPDETAVVGYVTDSGTDVGSDVLVATDSHSDASADHAQPIVAVDSGTASDIVPLTDLAPTVSVVRQRREQLLRRQEGDERSNAEDTLDVAADTAPMKQAAPVLDWDEAAAQAAAQGPRQLPQPAANDLPAPKDQLAAKDLPTPNDQPAQQGQPAASGVPVTLPAAADDLDDGVDDERAEPVADILARERLVADQPVESGQRVESDQSAAAAVAPQADHVDVVDVDASEEPLAPVIDDGPAAVRPGQKQWPGMAYRPSPRLWAGYRRPNLRGGPFSRTTRPVDDVVPVGDVEPVREKPADRPEWADRPRYIPIGAMVPSDVNACGQMRGEFGWKPTLAQLYWANDIADGYVATVDDEIGGVFFVHPYGETATVSNVLVRKRFHYCGLGTRMMKFLLTKYPDLEFRLDATDEAKPLFKNFGFYEAGERVTFRGAPEQLRGGALPFGVRPLLPLDWPHIMRLDAGGYGEGRADFLRSAADHADEVAVGVAGFGDIRCFGVRWHDGQDHVIGPVAATSFDAARAMIGHLAEGCTGTVQLTIGQEHSRLIEWLHSCGFEVTDRSTHMVRPVGEPVALPDTDTCYVTGSSAFG